MVTRKVAARIVLVGSPADPQVRSVGAALRLLRAPHAVVDFSALEAGESWCMAAGGTQAALRFAGVRWDRVCAVYVRQVPGAWPPLGRNAQGRPVVLQQWMTPFMLARERESVALGWLMELQQRGVVMLNPPASGALSQNKSLQLTRAAALGVPVPRTLVTNDVEAATAFVKRHRRVIAKPVQGGALTVALDADTVEQPRVQKHLARIKAAPITLQQRVDGDDIRLMLLDGRVVSCLAVRLPEGPVLDFRGSAAYQRGEATYERVKLPAATRALAARWARACGLVFAGIDLKRTRQGKFVFLECNSSPVFLDGELKSGDPISMELAKYLASRV